jgi:hypothetical protein
MHERAAKLTGAVNSAAVIAIETMILLNIYLVLALIRRHVDEKRSALTSHTNLHTISGTSDCAHFEFSADTASNAFVATAVGVLVCISPNILRGRRLQFTSSKERL